MAEPGQTEGVQPVTTETLGRVKPRVLFVDDNDAMRKIGSMVLGRLNVPFETAMGFQDAVQVFTESAKKGETFNTGIFDYDLIGLNGGDIALEIKKIAEEFGVPMPRLIFLTGRSADDIVFDVLRNAGVDFSTMRKPIGVPEITQKLAEIEQGLNP